MVLVLFKNAECVVTDTFHGTITASITNVPMAVLIRNSLNSNKMTDLLGKSCTIIIRFVFNSSSGGTSTITHINIPFFYLHFSIALFKYSKLSFLSFSIFPIKNIYINSQIWY